MVNMHLLFYSGRGGGRFEGDIGAFLFIGNLLCFRYLLHEERKCV